MRCGSGEIGTAGDPSGQVEEHDAALFMTFSNWFNQQNFLPCCRLRWGRGAAKPEGKCLPADQPSTKQQVFYRVSRTIVSIIWPCARRAKSNIFFPIVALSLGCPPMLHLQWQRSGFVFHHYGCLLLLFLHALKLRAHNVPTCCPAARTNFFLIHCISLPACLSSLQFFPIPNHASFRSVSQLIFFCRTDANGVPLVRCKFGRKIETLIWPQLLLRFILFFCHVVLC
jgi:hypothetical protein